jgi:signal transduction histidine kinase
MSSSVNKYGAGLLPPRWEYWLTQPVGWATLTAARITLVYLVFGFLALYLSDVVFVELFSEPLLSRVQAAKGGVEVLLTGGLIYGLTRRSRRALQRRNERLREQRRELQVLHRVFRHNLRNDLNVLKGYAELVLDELADGDLRAACETIVDTSRRIDRYSEQAARIRDLSEQNTTVVVDLSECLPRIVDSHDRVTEAVEVSVETPETASVTVHPEFETALRELISNAIEHTDTDSPRVDISVDPEGGPAHKVEVHVRDNGPGIPEHELEALETGESDQLVHLSGLGLWFVYWTVDRSGGDISFDRNGGTCVRVAVLEADPFRSRMSARLQDGLLGG